MGLADDLGYHLSRPMPAAEVLDWIWTALPTITSPERGLTPP